MELFLFSETISDVEKNIDALKESLEAGGLSIYYTLTRNEIAVIKMFQPKLYEKLIQLQDALLTSQL